MRAWTYALLALGACALVACGKGEPAGRGDADVVGRWTLDFSPLLERQLEAALAENAKRLEGLPADQLEAARAQQPSVEQLREKFQSEIDATVSVLEIRADLTYLHTTTVGGKVTDSGGGTWHRVGDRITLLPRTHNDGPAEGIQAQPVILAVEGGGLTMQASPRAPRFRLRRTEG